VLNSRRFFAGAEPPANADDALDPRAVARVNRIIERTSAKVVISSTWRITDPLERILAILAAHGFAGDVVGMTPIVGGSRGHQIRSWLDANRGVTSYVILDDATDMDRLGGRQVRTMPDDGLLDEHVEAACRVLGRRLWWRW
jgi:hypothetical protein